MPVISPEQVADEATRLSIEEVAGYLQAQLGQRLTAYLGGVSDPKVAGRWASGKAEPRDAAQMRLRDAFQATRLVAEAYGAKTAKAWWVGSNTRLDDEAPALTVRYARTPDDLSFVVPAARAFAGGVS